MTRTTKQKQVSISDKNLSVKSNSTLSVTKYSKQLNYYYRHRKQINTKRKSNRKNQIKEPKHNSNSLQSKKSNDILQQINFTIDISKNNQNKPETGLFNMLTYAQSHLKPKR